MYVAGWSASGSPEDTHGRRVRGTAWTCRAGCDGCVGGGGGVLLVAVVVVIGRAKCVYRAALIAVLTDSCSSFSRTDSVETFSRYILQSKVDQAVSIHKLAVYLALGINCWHRAVKKNWKRGEGIPHHDDYVMTNVTTLSVRFEMFVLCSNFSSDDLVAVLCNETEHCHY